MSAPKWNRKLHRWGALLTFAPLAIIITSGLLLQLKKDWSWVQPPTLRGQGQELTLGWDEILEATINVPEAEVQGWDDIDRLDVRPEKGLVKVRCNNRWEVQLDAETGAVLSSTRRRSDLIESIHDGSWFHDRAKLWIWLPTAIILCGLWGTGVYLWLLPHLFRRRRRVKPRT
jgi:hypothetical protein